VTVHAHRPPTVMAVDLDVGAGRTVTKGDPAALTRANKSQPAKFRSVGTHRDGRGIHSLASPIRGGLPSRAFQVLRSPIR